MELLLARIIAGVFRFKHAGSFFYIRQPNRVQQYHAQLIYEDSFNSGLENHLFSDTDLLKWMQLEGEWDLPRQARLNELPKLIEGLKVNLYEAALKSNTRRHLKNELGAARKEYAELLSQRHAHDHLSAKGLAQMDRAKYTIGISLYRANGREVFTDDNFWQSDDEILEAAITVYNDNRIEEKTYRALARSDQWRTYYSAGKQENSIFGGAVVDLTDEQRTLLNWSSLYENIHEHPDCPSDQIIEDDDVLDGWLIKQRREKEKKNNQKDAASVIENDKIRNAEEVFIVAETAEDARKVMDLNDDFGKMMIESKFDLVHKKGIMRDDEMPDAKLKILGERNKANG